MTGRLCNQIIQYSIYRKINSEQTTEIVQASDILVTKTKTKTKTKTNQIS